MSSPFGIVLEQPLIASSSNREIGLRKYEITPPSPHPSFTTYYVEEGVRQGVIWIKGIGTQVDNDRYGNGIKGQIERLSTQLEGRYGKPRRVDLADSSGI